MAGKMSPKFIALCSLAVGAIYSTGYAITANGSTALAAPTQQNHASAPPTGAANSTNSTQSGSNNSSKGNSTANSSKSSSTNATQSSSQSSSKKTTTSGSSSSKSTSKTSGTSTTKSTPKKTSKPAPNTTQQYLDGTYNGSASNRIGMVSVAVAIKQGKIANVQITACDTHYPQSYIDPVLPNYVVANQTTRIPVVSGATLSTADFYYALVQALSQAKNPNYKG